MNMDDLPEEQKKQLIETSDFFIGEIDYFIKELKQLKNKFKSHDINVNSTAIFQAIAIKKCLDEYDFHYNFIVREMEKNGIIEKSN